MYVVSSYYHVMLALNIVTHIFSIYKINMQSFKTLLKYDKF